MPKVCEMLQQGGDCLTFLYTPNDDSAVNAIVAAMCSNNVPAVPQSRTMGFASMSEVTMCLAAKIVWFDVSMHVVTVYTHR